VVEAEPTALAPGFRAAGVACGLKSDGGTDVGIVACDAAAEIGSALLLTRNAAAAAPVRVCRERCDRASIRAAVVNSGNANAATGEQGYADAVAMQERCAAAIGVEAAAVAVAETGTIGVPLDVDRVLDGIDRAAASTGPAGGADFSAAIMTTDAGRFVYTVVSSEIVKPDALWVVDQTPEATATLFACHPPGRVSERIVVHLALSA